MGYKVVSRAFVAWENKIEPKCSEKYLQFILNMNYHERLHKYSLIDARSTKTSRWSTNIKEWPIINLGTIFSFTLEKKEHDTDFVGPKLILIGCLALLIPCQHMKVAILLF